MDALTLVMFSFVFLVGFVFFLLGFFELKNTFLEKEAASPTMGFMYYLVSLCVWFALSMWWFAMATDPVLAVLGWLWFAFGWLSLTLALTCGFYMFKASVNKSKDGGLSLEFNEAAA